MATQVVCPPARMFKCSSHAPSLEALISAKDFSPPGQRLFSGAAAGGLQQSSLSLIYCCSKPEPPNTGSSRKPRSARAFKNDSELCGELRRFLAAEGFPSDKVPSTKELSNRGREDLAKIVRRRGYKVIGRLLASSEIIPSTVDEDSSKPTGTNDAVDVFSEVGLHPPQAMLSVQAPNGSARLHLADSETAKNPKSTNELFRGAGSLIESETDEQLRKKASEFVRTGVFKNVQGLEGVDKDEEEDEDDEEEYESDGYDSEDLNDALHGGRKMSAETIAMEKATKLRAKLLPFFTGTFQDKTINAIGSLSQDQKGVGQELLQPTNVMQETQLEIKAIKSALLSREQELAEVSQELKETKAQLALVQAKATAELAQAKQIALEKEMRLKTVDHALAYLKQVQVEYWGEGGRVELAGSFNGWKYFIALEPDSMSEISKPDGSKGPMMWGTELWLYPGTYEIKFIVDGNWLVDQRREVVLRNTVQNNVLRVEP